MPTLSLSLGVYAGHLIEDAIGRAIHYGLSDPLLGRISTDKLQICPQNRGPLTPDIAGELRDRYRNIDFYLHANVQTQPTRSVFNLSAFAVNDVRWKDLSLVCSVLEAKHYSAHAGRRDEASLEGLIDNIRRAEDLFSMPVAVEGHYPEPRNVFLLTSWREYEVILRAGIHYVIDLSHINILVRREPLNSSLLQELLSFERCLEVHLSGNDGHKDSHHPLNPDSPPWWLPYLSCINPNAVVFYEGRA